ncbi:glycoside hydrolase family 9 protein [Nonomuraea dietziae]|uniref:glycoside hydrolase family 9 protein n=1 Tax=Nonomuraea dietziae TaxID=65515 RepID=UPI0033EB9B76
MMRHWAAALSLLASLALVPATAHADEGPEQIVNGTFETGTAPWWSTSNTSLAVSDGRLCADIPGGTANPWDVIIGLDGVPLVAGETYAYRYSASASPAKVARALIQLPVDPWTQYLSASPELGPEPGAHHHTFTAPVSLPNAQVAFQLGGGADPWRFCLDDVSLKGGADPDVHEPDTGPRVRVNMVGYLTKGPKNATVVTDLTTPFAWQLKNAGGDTVAEGSSRPRGLDASSGQNVHSIDFGSYARPGQGYTLTADGETSRPFDIADDLYDELRVDALKFYYTQRSGIEIRDDLRPGYGRPAGHLDVAPNKGDTKVPYGDAYTLDVRGGWYDAGDHGKYVVNGGISVHQLMSAYERDKTAFTDGQLTIPESGNGVPDILDEARWELEFLLSMQVPDGRHQAGMAHHKIHDVAWTGLPLLPHLDPQQRTLHPPSTAATLNLAATAAQAARIFAPYDAAFAARAMTAARKAWAAAMANPAVLADPADNVGGGPYDDKDVSDEFYWAAAELFITTGEKPFADFVMASPHHRGDVWLERGFDWGHTAQLGRLQLAAVPNALPDRARVRASVLRGADSYLATLRSHPYGVPYGPPDYDWGSNNLILNNMVVMAVAHDLSGKEKYRAGVREGMDYVLGRNALNQSYVTGYGEVAAKNQHSRWYARQLDPSLPNPPRGTLSGGPNSAIQDPVAQRLLKGCAPQFCYIDDIESWSTNELTINWNSPLAWIASFLADRRKRASCAVSYAAHGPAGQIRLTNTGKKTLEGWSLRWWFPDGRRVARDWGAELSQSGPVVTARGPAVRAGRSVVFGFLSDRANGASPEVFLLDGARCA